MAQIVLVVETTGEWNALATAPGLFTTIKKKTKKKKNTNTKRSEHQNLERPR